LGADAGDPPPAAGQVPRRHWKERAMILIGLIVFAVLMIVVLPRIRRKL
jgi:hypothetical protein